MGVHLAVTNEVDQSIGTADGVVEVSSRVVRVDVFALELQVRSTHLGHRPCRRRDHTLRTPLVSTILTSYMKPAYLSAITREAAQELMVHALLLDSGPLTQPEPPEPRPVSGLELAHPVEQHVERVAGEVMADNDIGIRLLHQDCDDVDEASCDTNKR